MSFFQICLIIFTIFALSLGQIFLKIASMKLGLTIEDNFAQLFSNKFLLIALLFYIASTISWIILLKNVALSVAYPFSALGFILVPVLSYFILNEEIGGEKIVGGFVILVGVYIASR